MTGMTRMEQKVNFDLVKNKIRSSKRKFLAFSEGLLSDIQGVTCHNSYLNMEETEKLYQVTFCAAIGEVSSEQ